MRLIKFRGKRIEERTWIYGDLARYNGQANIVLENGACLFVDPETVSQYTGINDKNGKEIYEGDLLKDRKGVGEVKWVQEHCAFLIRTLNPHMYHYLESDERLTESEVTGNIYTNPELLEATP